MRVIYHFFPFLVSSVKMSHHLLHLENRPFALKNVFIVHLLLFLVVLFLPPCLITLMWSWCVYLSYHFHSSFFFEGWLVYISHIYPFYIEFFMFVIFLFFLIVLFLPSCVVTLMWSWRMYMAYWDALIHIVSRIYDPSKPFLPSC